MGFEHHVIRGPSFRYKYRFWMPRWFRMWAFGVPILRYLCFKKPTIVDFGELE